MTEKLKYLSGAAVDELRSKIVDNVDRYRSGDFHDLMDAGEWSIELKLEADTASLSGLDPSGTPATEISNSKLVWKALHGLTPALAYEEGIWVRLTHIECLPYARARWLRTQSTDEEIVKDVTEHFFADTLTKRRDDNAISRLWWNAFIANLVMPGSGLSALDVILMKADIRLNFVERSMTVSRPLLAAGIVRVMQRHAWATEREDNFRSFMRTLNRLGGGYVFEVLSEADIDAFVEECARRAGMPATPSASAASTIMPLAASPQA